MVYFRRIESANIDYFATNSDGNFVALLRKMDEESKTSWSMFIDQLAKEAIVEGVCLEEAMDAAILHYASVRSERVPQKRRSKS